MFNSDSKMGDLMELPKVKAFLEKAAPQMVSEPAKGMLSGLTISQIKGFQAEAAPMLDAVVALANGEEIDFQAFDLSKQKPVVKCGPLVAKFDIDDVDGKMYMLDHSFSGCFVVAFSKPMNMDKKGTITYQGKAVPYVFKLVEISGGIELMGIYVRNICTEYGASYTFHIEGFQDADGNEMDPADYVIETQEKTLADPAYLSHDAVAKEAASEGMVLLKNNGILPLARDKSVAVINGELFRLGAVGAGKINPRYQVRILEAFEKSSFTVTDNADTVCLVISRASGENYDNGNFKGDFYLTDEEEAQIAECKEKYSHIIAIINSGYPMDVRWTLDEQVDAAIWTGYPGMLGGEALVDLLNGTANPSGKLPDTWSLDYDDIPSSKNFYVAPSPEEAIGADTDVWIDTVYEEDIYVGYRYFETFHKSVAYPFGYGLSYTTFETKAVLADHDLAGVISGSASFKVEATIKNTGSVPGKQVIEIYAAIPDGRLEQPAKRLVGFGKTALLAPEETETLTIELPIDRFSSFDEEASAFILEKGTYELLLGASVSDTVSIAHIELKEDVTLRTAGDYMAPPVDFTRLSKRDPASYPAGKMSGLLENVHTLQHKAHRTSISDEEAASGRTAIQLFGDKTNAEVDSWTEEELARFSICASSGWGMQDVGVAGRISQLEGRNLPYYAVSDGNNGVNINKPNIGMPTSNLVCATWNPDMSYKVATVIAEEAKENNVNMILAPAMNLHRNPLCGRHPEYFSEDPLLGGIMAGNHSKGLEDHGVSSTVKHVCCNGAESSRKRNHSIVSKRALRELYLRTFEVAFQVNKPDSIMTAYNACNGVFTAEDEELLQGVFRKEFGFDGFVMTDWNSYDTADVAAAVQAGNCWLTPGSSDDTYVTPVLDGIKNGTIKLSRLRQNIKYMYHIIMKYIQTNK